MPHKCCSGIGGKHKKIFTAIVVIIVLGVAVLVIAAGAKWKLREAQYCGNMMYGYNGERGFGGMMNGTRGAYQIPVQPINENQFVLPEDAAKSGELAIVVNDLESAKKAVSDVAAKSNGSVYATFVSYVSSSVRNGSIVVQVPVENFDATFVDLKKVGNQVVQESTQQIPTRSIYPMPLAATDKVAADSAAPTADSQNSVVSPIAIQVQPTQNKGYIRVVFADYGIGSTDRSDAGKNAAYAAQNASNKLWLAFGIKLAILIVLFGILVVVLKKIFQNLRRTKKAKPAVHIVRQMPKTRQRVVRIAKRK